MVDGAINPTDPLSKEHWESSFGTALLITGVKPNITTSIDDATTTFTKGPGKTGTVVNQEGSVVGRDIRQVTSEEVNAKYPADYETPYKPNTIVTEFTTTSETDFVRVHGPNNRERSWVMKKSEIEGLTPEQIKDKFALPDTPTLITDVKVPPNTRMRVGEAGENKFGNGGGTQYELLERLDDPTAWENTRKLGE
jgi:filamentous hemagglutinin